MFEAIGRMTEVLAAAERDCGSEACNARVTVRLSG